MQKQEYKIPFEDKHKKMPYIRQVPKGLENFQHVIETRSQNQIALTNLLVNSLTQLNLKRIVENQETDFQKLNYERKQRFQNVLTVFIHGIPSFKNSFDFINFPGQAIHYFPACFGPHLKNQQQKRAQFQISDFKSQAQLLYQKIQKGNRKQKKLIFLFHSFGTYYLHSLLHYFPQIRQRMIGYIDIGGAPIRFYPVIITNLRKVKDMHATKQLLFENREFIHKQVIKAMTANSQQQNKIKDKSKRKAVFAPYQHQYQSIGMLNSLLSQELSHIFSTIRNCPEILKLILHGQFDDVFQTHLLNQKAVYFSYVQELSKEAENFYQGLMVECNKKYFSQTSKSIDRVQARLVYSIPRGKHSVHMQKKMHQIIKKAVHEYVYLIMCYEDQANKVTKPKL